jgi:O-antigen ligase
VFDYLIPEKNKFNIRIRQHQWAVNWWLWFLGMLGITAVAGFMMVRNGPGAHSISWLVYLLCAAAILYRPRYGVYLILFLALMGDNVLIPWFPFTKNFSSPESLLFIHRSLIISPLETFLVLTFLSWLLQRSFQRKFKFHRGPLLWPVVLLLVLTVFGLIYGILRNGNLTIALWEARPLFYLLVMVLLANNLIEKRQHVSSLMWFIMLALGVEAVAGVYFVFFVLEGRLSSVNTITEHSAAIHMNTYFIYIATIWLYKASPAKRLLLPVMLPFVLITYLSTQRRAAFLALFIALFFFAVVLYLDHRRWFWILVPPCLLLGSIYLGIFWNSEGTLGQPARAIKSVVAEEQSSIRDQSSNIYRRLENINSLYTIKQNIFTGIGFGQKYYMLVQLPDISFFEWWEYFIHNSILWIWLKTGLLGFLTMLFMLGSSIKRGAQVFRRMKHPELSAAALTFTLYIVMFTVFTYVDISWDTQSLLYLGAGLGLLNRLDEIDELPEEEPALRRPWEKLKQAHPNIRI